MRREAEVNSRESQSAAKVLQHEIVSITVGQGHDWLNSHDLINSSNTVLGLYSHIHQGHVKQILGVQYMARSLEIWSIQKYSNNVAKNHLYFIYKTSNKCDKKKRISFVGHLMRSLLSRVSKQENNRKNYGIAKPT